MKRCTSTGFLVSILLVIGLSQPARAADIRAFVDRTSLNPGESVQLTVTSSSGEADVDISSLRAFRVSSRGSSSSVQIVNGRVSREISYNYLLFPLKKGRLIIPALTVVADGKVYHTRPIAITVSTAPGKERTNDIFVEAEISDAAPFEGQQITYSFKLFRSVQIANAKFQKPAFSGFTAQEIGDQKSYQTVVSGRRYDVSALTYVLIPLIPGEKTIEPAILECDIVRPNKRRRNHPFDSFFNDPFFGRSNVEPRIIETKPLTVDIKPLPADKGTVKFSGLVGDFRISAHLDSDTLEVGDSATLSVAIEGKGNIMDAEEPEITVPGAFKTYKDKPEEDLQLTMAGYSGKKIFRIALVPIEAGTYRLAPINLRYFDIAKGRYLTRSTASIPLVVLPAKEKTSLAAFTPLTPDRKPIKNKVEFTGRDILPLNESLDAIKNHRSVSWQLFMLFLLVPALVYAGVRGILEITGKSDDPASRMAKRADKALNAARHALNRADAADIEGAVFTHLYRALVSAVLSKAGNPGESLTYAEVKHILHARGYGDDMCREAARLLERIESARFGGATGGTPTEKGLYTETKALVRRLSKS
ncbi:MAG: BatD family protein [Desulfobacterales bacterium]